jgi:mutator family transposase
VASVRPLTDLTVADLWKEVKDPATLWGDVSRETLHTVKCLLENRMLEELAEQLKAHWYAPHGLSPRYRNGHYIRRLTTTWGTIPNLEIPRPRAGRFTSAVLERYQRRMPQVNELVRRVFLGGLSTRQVGPVLAQLLQDTVSPTTVSQITQTLDQQVAAFHRRPLPDHYDYLFLDAVSLRVKTPDGMKRLSLACETITHRGLVAAVIRLPRRRSDERLPRPPESGEDPVGLALRRAGDGQCKYPVVHAGESAAHPPPRSASRRPWSRR